MTDTATSFRQLRELFADAAGVRASRMFGTPCLKIHGRVFVSQHAGILAFKLPAAAHARALELPGATRWNPSGRAPLREWVAVPSEHHAAYAELAVAAAGYVVGRGA